MNDLRVVTQPTGDKKTFDTYWMTGLVQKGRIRTTIYVSDDCAKVAAELAALQYLLETKNACGHDKSGAGLRLRVSQEDILNLLSESSQLYYLSDYANFLRTRFLGAEVVVNTDDFAWADESCERQVDEISVYAPSKTIIDIAGIGPVELRSHAVYRYIQRFGRPATKAWRDLIKLAKDAVQVSVPRKEIHNLKHRHRGMFYKSKETIFVVTEPEHPGELPRLVTVGMAANYIRE